MYACYADIGIDAIPSHTRYMLRRDSPSLWFRRCSGTPTWRRRQCTYLTSLLATYSTRFAAARHSYTVVGAPDVSASTEA